MKKLILFSFISFSFFFLGVGKINAQSCSGSQTVTVRDDKCNGKNCISGTQSQTYSCGTGIPGIFCGFITSEHTCGFDSSGNCYIVPGGNTHNCGGSGCNSDGNCLASGLTCCSGQSHGDGSCSSGVRCGPGGGATPGPGGGGCYRCHPGAAYCESYDPGGPCTTNCSACPAPTPTPGPGFACLTIPCVVDGQCDRRYNPNVKCLPGNNPPGLYCRNSLCPDNTIPGLICGCSGGSGIPCGQRCAGGCAAGSTCRFTNAPGGLCSANGSNTYCIGDTGNGFNTFNPDFVTPRCTSGDTGNNMLRRVSTGQTTGFTLAQIQSTCAPPPSVGGWWQVVGGDAITNGALQSNIPVTCVLPGCNPRFILDGTAGAIPGNAIFGGTTTLTTPNVSSKGWLGNSSYLGRKYDSAYFTNLIPTSVSFNRVGPNATQADFDGGVASNGYYWYRSTGNLTLTGNITINGNRKVVLFVDGGDFNINGKINIQTRGSGFFMAIVAGNINVGSSVTGAPSIEGLFVSDGSFSTGTGNLPLAVRGTVVGWGGVSLQRDLGVGNNTGPAETFEYGPDLVLLYPRDLVQDRINWQEVIP